MLVKSGEIATVVVDSVAALTPSAEIEGEMTDQQIGLQARLMSKALRKITHSASSSNCLVMFINQIRQKVGIMFGSPNTTPGGKALKFYSSVRIELRRGQPVKDGDQVIGNIMHIKVAKNKVAPPFKTAEVTIIHGKGISREKELLDELLESSVIKKRGAWFYYEDETIAQGEASMLEYIEENYDELAKRLETEDEQQTEYENEEEE